MTGRQSSGEAEHIFSPNVLFCYSRFPSYTNAVRDYVEAFGAYSRHRIHYYDAEAGPPRFDLEPFDAIIFNYCFWGRDLCTDAEFRKSVARFGGVKIAIFQDEYDHFLHHRRDVVEMGIDTIVTLVPPEHWRDVFREEPFRKVRFIHALTGYVPDSFLRMPPSKPMRERPWFIGYRARPVPFRYGRLTQDKVTIGTRMRAICEARHFTTNISVAEEDRLYGKDWFEFLGNCRAVLGTESGSNVFDFDGTIKVEIDAYLKSHPGAEFETVHRLFLEGHDGRIKMEQVSPRIFETIAAGTGLILFEGAYSGVVKPWEHFIPLKKDFSNVDAVLEAVADADGMEEMTRRAYADVIAPEKYHFRTYIARLDDHISESIGCAKGFEPMYELVGWRRSSGQPLRRLRPHALAPTSAPLRNVDRQFDPVFSLRFNPRAIQRALFHRYIGVVSSKKARRLQDRLTRYPAIYSIVRRGVRFMTGKG